MIVKKDYLTPTEVLKKYPELHEKFGWTSKDMGMFLRAKLLEGHYSHALRKSLIREDSIFRLVRFANEQIDKQKVSL